MLVGLTMEETLEFERLDRLGPLDGNGIDGAGHFGEIGIFVEQVTADDLWAFETVKGLEQQ